MSRIAPSPFRTVDWTGDAILILDQTLLPARESILRLDDLDALAEAIRSLRVRGAMALGVAGGLGIALAIRTAQRKGGDVEEEARRAARLLAATRPTAANLFWGIERVLAALVDGADSAVACAVGLIDEDIHANRRISSAGADLLESLRPPDRKLVLLTHCNAGGLAAVEVGTALGIAAELHARSRVAEVLACETRPLLQGARLTCWELQRAGIRCRLLVDAAAAGVIAGGRVDAVVVGADRIAANGDVANKVGTFAHALAARHAGIPFVVAAPESTIDVSTPDGARIPIEERSMVEVLEFAGRRVAPADAQGLNPAFDVTPATFVTAIVTDRRVIRTDRGETPNEL